MKLKFASNSAPAPLSPLQNKKSFFEDLVLKEKYKNEKLRLLDGENWLRFFPSIEGSQQPWLMPIEVYANVGGRSILNISTFSSDENPFKKASYWFFKNHKEALFNKDLNPHGLRLYPKKQVIAWAINEKLEEGQRLGLFVASNYGGEYGGKLGLGAELAKLSSEVDSEEGSPTFGKLLHGDICDPEEGKLVKITKTAAKDEFASYSISFGKTKSKIEKSLEKLTDEELAIVCPLEEVLNFPSAEEQHKILKNYIGNDFYSRIFS